MSKAPERIWRWWDERPKDAPRLVVVYSEAGEPHPEGAIPYTRDDIVADRIAEAVAKERERLTDVDRLAQIIRKVDGSNNIGAAALAEAIAVAIRQTEGEG